MTEAYTEQRQLGSEPANDLDGHAGIVLSGEAGQAFELTGSVDYVLRGDSDEFRVSDALKWGVGAAFPSRSPFRALVEQMGGQVFSPMPTQEQGYGIATGGRIIHELGVTRMGNDPKTSVLNKYCQAHDAKNVFVADAGPFVSQADKNPTWTILALAWRTADYIAEQRRTGAI